MSNDSYSIPRLKGFKYRVEFNGEPYFLVQEFDPGDRVIGVTKHAGGGQNHPAKEAGLLEYHDAVLKSVVPISGDGMTYWEDWMNSVQDPASGDGDAVTTYFRNFSMYEMDNSGNSVRVWEFYRAFPSQYKLGNKQSLQADKDVIEEIHITYEYRDARQLT